MFGNHPQNGPRPTARRSARGSVLFMVLVLLISIMAVISLAVDIPRKEVMIQELQNALDAATLAGSAQLDGSPLGLRRACEAVQGILNLSSVNGESIANNSFTVEFGPYQINPDNSCMKEFDSRGSITIEGADNTGIDTCAEVQPDWTDPATGLPVSLIGGGARAMRLTVTMDAVPTMFARVLGAFTTPSVTRQSIATATQRTSQCVAPIAIPACDLLLEVNPTDRTKFQTFELDIPDQCGRELVFVEANPWDINQRPLRGEGLIRHSMYRRPSLWNYSTASEECGYAAGSGVHVNCRADPIMGVLGVPHAACDSPSQPASAADLRDHLNNNNGCIETEIGAYFRPIQNATAPVDGLLGNPDNSLANPRVQIETRLAELINDTAGTDPNRMFTQVFGDPIDNVPPIRANYPFRRFGADELVYRWPPYESAQRVLLGGPADWWRWTIPTAHHPAVNHDSPTTSKVLPVTAMVIAQSSGTTPYCDFQNLLNQEETLNSTPPHLGTKPRVIGFVTAYLIDFNFRDLSAAFATQNDTANFTSGANPVLDPNPRGIRVP